MHSPLVLFKTSITAVYTMPSKGKTSIIKRKLHCIKSNCNRAINRRHHIRGSPQTQGYVHQISCITQHLIIKRVTNNNFSVAIFYFISSLFSACRLYRREYFPDQSRIKPIHENLVGSIQNIRCPY